MLRFCFKTLLLLPAVLLCGCSKIKPAAPETLDVVACLSQGQPSQPCNGFEIPLPILVSTKLKVAIDLSGKG